MRCLSTWLFLIFSQSVIAGPGPGIRFIENKNQWRPDVLFRAQFPHGAADFGRDNIRFVLMGRNAFIADKPSDTSQLHFEESGYLHTREGVDGHVVEVRFLGSNPHAVVTGGGETDTRYNFFLGNDRARWASGARSYDTVSYHQVYNGIDMRYYGSGEYLKYEWIVAPQVDPDQIALQYNGTDQLYVDEENLYVKTSVGEFWEMKPFAYQVKEGKRVQVPCRYQVDGTVVHYIFPEGYDECDTLVIDPILIFSAYSGSFADNWGNTATYDARGNVYSGGMVSNAGLDYPTTPGAYQTTHAGGFWDVGILKYDSGGTRLLYCTYLGGTDTETPQSLVVNNAGELLILGATGSSDFPVTNASAFSGGSNIDPLGSVFYQQGTDIFVAKLSRDGSQLTAATYLGGTANDGVNFISGSMVSAAKVESPLARNYGDQLRGDIVADSDNYVYIASNTLSADFPIVSTGSTFAGGSLDAVVVKLAPDLSDIVWSRFIGGSQADAAYSVKVHSGGDIFVSGGSNSGTIAGMNGFKTLNSGGVDGWVMSLRPDGAVRNGTFIGTPAYDQSYFVDLDEDGDVFLYGQTMGDYPVSRSKGVYNNPRAGQFLQKVSHDLTDTLFSTVIGTGGNRPNISPTAFLVSDCGYIYMSGWGGAVNATVRGGVTRNYVGGNTFNMPISADAYQRTTQGNDFYFMVLSEDATQFLYGTYFGGVQSSTHVDGGTSRFDKNGIVYHAVCAGCGGFSDFPAVNAPPAHRRNRSGNCNNAVFKFDLSLLKARLQTNSVALNNPGVTTVCFPDKIVFQNKSFGGELFEWDLGDGTRMTRTDTSMIVHQYKEYNKSYTVWLRAIDPGTCQGRDSVSTTIYVYKAEATVQDDDELCRGSEYTLQADGGATYAWQSKDGTFQSGAQNPKVTPLDTTVYYVTITETFGCTYKDTVQLNVIPAIVPQFDMQRSPDCFERPSIRLKNITDSLWASDNLYFDLGDGHISDADEVVHDYEQDGTYTVRLVGGRNANDVLCVSENALEVHVFTLVIPNVITPDASPGANDTFIIQYGTVEGSKAIDYGFPVSLSIYNRWGDELYHSSDYQNNWAGAGLASGVYFFEVTVQSHATCKGWVQLIK